MNKTLQTYKKLLFLTGFLLFTATKSNSQCSVTAPNDATINCGSSATLSATTTAVTYSLVATNCTPVAITGTTAFPTPCDDCVTGQIPIGFPFNFYGNTYTTAVIQSNGILGFGPFTFTGYNSFSIPALGNPNNYIAGFFADIDIRYGGTITYQTVGTAPNRRFVVSYNNVVPWNGSSAGTGTASFQIIINENGSFNIVISQLSADWYSGTSGALATSGAENDTGTYAFPVPGRNATDWPGITPAQQDCYLFNPSPCVFQRWQQGTTLLTTNPNLTVSPTTTTTYTAYWNCGGSICSDDTVVNVITPTITAGTTINNTNCTTPNGTIPLNFNGFAPGTYTLNYLLNGVSQNQTITVGSSTIINQGSIFNTGSLSSTDLTWYKNSSGTFCDATSGTIYYLDYISFTPTLSGTYTFNMCTPGTDWDGLASLYQNAFTNTDPCATPGNYIITDDDGSTGGNCENDSRITASLSVGVTYFLVTTSYFTSTTGNYEWTYSGPAGATINTSNSNSYTISNINNGTYSNFTMGSGTCGTGTLAGPITITSPSTLATTGTSICAGGTGSISAASACGTSGSTVNQGAIFNTGSLSTTDSTWNRNSGGTSCNGSASGSCYYDVATFTVSTAGSYTFRMCTPVTNFDGHASLYQNAFDGLNPCGIPGNYLIADDDSNTGGNCENDALITITLSPGITYYLVTTSFFDGETGNYEWSFTGPTGATINSGATGGTLQWYTTATGGSSISSANPFNPVGVTGSGLVNTNTTGTYTYYAACSTNTTCRTATTFVITSGPKATISGNGTVCNGSTTISVALIGSQPWSITYTNGSTPTTITGITSSPYTFVVSPTTATTYTLTAASDSSCSAIPASLTGSATVGGKIWLGGNNNWSVASNWSSGVIPNNTDCVIIPVTANNPIISGTNYNGLAGTLRVNNGATLTVNSGNNLSVTNGITIITGGNLVVQDDANLVQVTNTGIINNGNITLQRTTAIRQLDYVYWSSPVKASSTPTYFPVSQISPLTPLSVIWKWKPTHNGTDYGIWENANEGMLIGKGYIIRGPNGHSTSSAADYTATFVGIPNNGLITTPILRGTRTTSYTSAGGTATQDDDNWNLIGNPYPSSIDALAFLSASVNPNLDGSVRLWTHGNLPSTLYPDPFYQDFIYNYTANDYVNYNTLGSTPPGFLGKIGAGQSFFVLMNHSAVSPGLATFNNNMRYNSLFIPYSNNQFYRTNTTTPTIEIEKHRIWLNITDATGLASNTLVGYATEATLEKDRNFDAVHKVTDQLGLYSLINEQQYIIQGRPLPFNQNDIVPLGVSIPTAGNYSISINLVDGLFENPAQKIYVEDTFLGIIHDLRAFPYSFTETAGIHESRFFLRYTNQSLHNNDFESSNTIKVITNQNISINSSAELMESIVVYDVLGRKLADYKNVNANEFTIKDLQKNNAPLLLKIKLQNGFEKTQKIIY